MIFRSFYQIIGIGGSKIHSFPLYHALWHQTWKYRHSSSQFILFRIYLISSFIELLQVFGEVDWFWIKLLLFWYSSSICSIQVIKWEKRSIKSIKSIYLSHLPSNQQIVQSTRGGIGIRLRWRDWYLEFGGCSKWIVLWWSLIWKWFHPSHARFYS